MKGSSVLLASFCIFCLTQAFHNPYPKIRPLRATGDVGEPLFLTPYIEAGRIEEGQAAAKVQFPGSNVTSYAGYLTVNKTYNSNMFFWFFPSEVDPQNAPVVLWLQGGPGGSSLFGLFCENGPFYVDKQGHLNQRQYYWSQVFNVIYIDNPVGTGFSFTDDEAGYANDEVSVGRDLYSALIQFFQLFPNLQQNEFYASGESYAGKYVPAIGYTIHTNNKIKQQKINLKGVAIGDGFTDPENMMVYSDLLYQIGMIDSNTREVIEKLQDHVVKDIQLKDFAKANMDYSKLFHIITTEAGVELNVYNYIQNKGYSPYGDLSAYIQSSAVRKSIHVGNLTYNDGLKVMKHLLLDDMKSVKPWVEVLLDNYRVLFYNGQLDIICGYPLTVNFLQKLEWSGAESYKSAPRKQWTVGDDLAGYSKTVGGFSEVLVRDAGHMVPQDQPKWALDLMSRFLYNKPF